MSVLGCGTWFFPIEEQLCYKRRVPYYDSRSIHTHKGNHREFCPEHFYEIIRHQEAFPSSVVKFLHRADDVWIREHRYHAVVMEHREGVLFESFIKQHANNTALLVSACDIFGREVRTLHQHQVAHGSPGLAAVLHGSQS